MTNNDWINKVIDETVQGKQSKRRIQSGIDHLHGKKLYKYYSFSSDYTISNLKNDTIYLQNPVLFNDPFDCNIGISVNQLIRALAPDLFNQILPNTSSDIREVLESCLLSDDAYDLAEESKERMLALCANSPSYMKMIDKAKEGQELSDQELLSIVLEDSNTTMELIKIYLAVVANDEALSFDDVAMRQIIKSPQMIRGLIMSCAETRDIKERELLDLLTSKDDFFSKVESIADIVGQNIPKEEISRVYSMLDDGIKQIREALGKQVGIECFTQSPTDILMWSYYADKHTGVCVEYDFSQLFSSLANAFLFPVKYSENRPLLNIERIFDIKTQQVNNNCLKEEIPNIMWSWITKSSEWEREKEWRLIMFPIKNDDERLVKLPIISRIITGINISEDNYQQVSAIAKEKGIPVHRTCLKNDQYKIEIINE